MVNRVLSTGLGSKCLGHTLDPPQGGTGMSVPSSHTGNSSAKGHSLGLVCAALTDPGGVGKNPVDTLHPNPQSSKPISTCHCGLLPGFLPAGSDSELACKEPAFQNSINIPNLRARHLHGWPTCHTLQQVCKMGLGNPDNSAVIVQPQLDQYCN